MATPPLAGTMHGPRPTGSVAASKGTWRVVFRRADVRRRVDGAARPRLRASERGSDKSQAVGLDDRDDAVRVVGRGRSLTREDEGERLAFAGH